MSRVRIVTIEGNIGAGKSTLLTALREHAEHVIFVNEPVDEWDTVRDEAGVTVLQNFYNNPSKFAFQFQVMAFTSRLALLRDAVNRAKEIAQTNHTEVLVVSERSMLTDKHVFADMMYDMGHLDKIGYAIYTRWFSVFAEEFDVTDVVFLDVSPETCTARVATRARPGEDPISLEYLTRCGAYHTKFIAGLRRRQKRILTLDGGTAPSEWIRATRQFLRPAAPPAAPPVPLALTVAGVRPPVLHRDGRPDDTRAPLMTSIDLHAAKEHVIPGHEAAAVDSGLVIKWNTCVSFDHHFMPHLYVREPALDCIPNLTVQHQTYTDHHRGEPVVVHLANVGDDPIVVPKGLCVARAWTQMPLCKPEL